MPYSLVSAATLGFDLVRLPAGRLVADVVLAGLLGGREDLARLAAAHPALGLDRTERGVLAVRSRRARELAVAVPQVRALGGQDPAGASSEQRAAVLVAQLEQGTIGDAPTLERLLRDDVLGPEHALASATDEDLWARAADVLADAAVGWWSAGVLPPLVRRELTGPFERAGLPPARVGALDLGAAAAPLERLLDQVRGLDDAGRAAWRAAVDAGRAQRRPWATAMHEAAWAAHVSGRTRTLAAAQLLAVQAFLDGGFSGRDGAFGVWNALAGCVQGLTMADLLDEQAGQVLSAPFTSLGG